MRMYDIIYKKREGGTLTKEEIRFFIEGYVKGDIPDYQASALLMAAFIRGFDDTEMTELTTAMADSGDKADLSGIHGVIADKHSTGGVADTTTLVAAPVAAACGVKMAKMSGRGLGHTGGTLDKLESIPGFSTSIDMRRFIDQVNGIGIAVIGQTMSLCPADKKLYALRDVTATVDNIALIASSIMSKKIASGAPLIVLDVKTGSGAFMREYQDSLALAEAMVRIGNLAGRRTSALITDMNQPLGLAIGNALEVKEAVEIMQGQHEGDLKTLAVRLAGEILLGAGLAEDIESAVSKAARTIGDGSALEKFREMVKAQGGDEAAIDDPDSIIHAGITYDLVSEGSGYVAAMDTTGIGIASAELGAGRKTKEDVIDMSAGIWMHKRIGDPVKKGEPICTLYANGKDKLDAGLKALKRCITVGKDPVEKPKLVYARVTDKGVTEF
jgi:pyrimidine-nucleoside phosphorylase